MKNEIEAMITDITATTAEAEDYTGEDGLLYCGKCHTPKEAYFAEGKTCFGRDRHPTDCDCQRAAREKQQAAESRQKHLEKVEDLKRRGFTDPAMRNWTFEHDNGRNPQTATARFYVESWETMQAENIGYLFWGGVGTGKSYLAACIANALMEKEVAVCMTNFATILGDLAASFEGRNECGAIDNILAKKPKDYEDFLQKLEQQGYEVKRGKYTSVKGARQKRFIRFRTLGAGYSEEELKAVISGETEHHPRQKQKRIVPEQKFQMLVDIQAKLAEGKSMGYARWAKRYNLKEMSKTLIFLQEHPAPQNARKPLPQRKSPT